MKRLNKRIRTLFFFALGLSVGLPAGIVGIVFGAVFKIIPLLVCGIILTVIGFYVMPILWVRYGERRGDRSLLYMIENDHLYTVKELSRQTNYPENEVRARIKRLILSRCLVGYLFQDDTLVLNTNEKQAAAPKPSRTCRRCGAEMIHDGTQYFCEYCKHTETN